MLTLSRPNNKPNFHPLELADGVSLRVQITPPSCEQMVRRWMVEDPTAVTMAHLELVTDWLDVFVERKDADGGREALPFSQAALTELFRQYPAALGRLLRLIDPFFIDIDEVTEKNSDAPQSGAT